jgi:hypothetical protein
VREGANLLELMFDNGRVVHCSFNAESGTTVRWVGDDKISVDDGDARPCQLVKGG